ncbi:uncharacterized protein MONBRDRAFT_38410 [Monosiga brevicollis MX1]|uniref:Fungal lipase-type domain-containing protein n=1 Tax=Monosiga brevicollis TaxID=81824 RepID=A9V7K5_MONBE|nr:uncharacterized protein MONBRDRAFT_38410 [Monosiga brevicollis MX1]EDQ86600.1 predicted protein [Monosiga brevicollis MX1]|eukprot:XP_001748713.1 hypothetical protein [Monosiga brevicollis MX1]
MILLWRALDVGAGFAAGWSMLKLASSYCKAKFASYHPSSDGKGRTGGGLTLFPPFFVVPGGNLDDNILRPQQYNQPPPANYYRYTPDSFDALVKAKTPMLFSHLSCAFGGTVTNRMLRSVAATAPPDLQREILILCGDGESLCQNPNGAAGKHVISVIATAAALADLTYAKNINAGLREVTLFTAVDDAKGEEHGTAEKRFMALFGAQDANFYTSQKPNVAVDEPSFAEYLLGRRWAVIGSPKEHPNALLVGLKAKAPSFTTEEDRSAETVARNEAPELEVTLVFRGSFFDTDDVPDSVTVADEQRVYTPKEKKGLIYHDWVGGNLRVSAVDAYGTKVHGGFQQRLELLWPKVVEFVNDALNDGAVSLGCAANKFSLSFAIAGHSQGAGIATLAALKLLTCTDFANDGGPDNRGPPRIHLYTFASPAVVMHDQLPDTHIRHFRFLLNNDWVPTEPPRPRWAQRFWWYTHSNDLAIVLDGKKNNYAASWVGADAHSAYAPLLLRLAEGDMSVL